MKKIGSIMAGFIGGLLAIVALITTAATFDNGKILSGIYALQVQPSAGYARSNVFYFADATTNTAVLMDTNAQGTIRIKDGGTWYTVATNNLVVLTNPAAGGWTSNRIVRGYLCVP
jgi:hypothetical protein